MRSRVVLLALPVLAVLAAALLVHSDAPPPSPRCRHEDPTPTAGKAATPATGELTAPTDVTAVAPSTGLQTLTFKVGAGGGAHPPAGLHSYAAGETVTLSVAPHIDRGYRILAWGGDCAHAGTAPTCTLTMDADRTATVTFESPLPQLTVVSDGSPDSLLLEWSNAPDSATRWQYRQRRWANSEPGAWGEWTDIPGSNADTRGYCVRGLRPDTGYDHEVRAVAGSLGGAASSPVTNGTHGRDDLPTMTSYAVVEGDGRTEWQIGSFAFTIPDGLRMFAGVPWVAAGGYSGTPVYVVGGRGGLTFYHDVETVDRYIAPWPHPGTLDEDDAPADAPEDIGPLLDQIIASVRRLP